MPKIIWNFHETRQMSQELTRCIKIRVLKPIIRKERAELYALNYSDNNFCRNFRQVLKLRCVLNLGDEVFFCVGPEI
jgi:hypothetical protein